MFATSQANHFFRLSVLPARVIGLVFGIVLVWVGIAFFQSPMTDVHPGPSGLYDLSALLATVGKIFATAITLLGLVVFALSLTIFREAKQVLNLIAGGLIVLAIFGGVFYMNLDLRLNPPQLQNLRQSVVSYTSPAPGYTQLEPSIMEQLRDAPAFNPVK